MSLVNPAVSKTTYRGENNVNNVSGKTKDNVPCKMETCALYLSGLSLLLRARRGDGKSDRIVECRVDADLAR